MNYLIRKNRMWVGPCHLAGFRGFEKDYLRLPKPKRSKPWWSALKGLGAVVVGGLVVVMASPGALSCKSNAIMEKKMGGQVHEKTITQCIGRFCLDIPESMHRAGQAFEIADTEFEEHTLEPPAAYEKIWLAHLAKIETLKKNRSYPDDLYGEILEKRQLTPALRSVLFHEKVVGLTLGALLNAGPVALWMKVDGGEKYYDKMAARVEGIASKYRPRVKDHPWPAPGKDWFYMDRGAFAIDPKYEEKADVDFEGHPLKVKLTVTTETISEPPPGLFKRFMKVVMAGMVSGSSISMARKGRRKVAGLKGEELLVSDRQLVEKLMQQNRIIQIRFL